MRKLSIIGLTIALVLTLTACPPKYGDMMRSNFKNALGHDLSKYTFLSYPTDNFGVATIYDQSFDPSNFVCATWPCLGYPPAPMPTDASKILTINGNADVGTGGNITLSTDQQQDIAVNVVLPQIYNVLKVSAGTEWKKHTTVTLAANKGHIRMLDRLSFASYITSLPATNAIKSGYDAGRLVVIVSDFVIDSMTVTIDIDNSDTSNLDASLTGALGGQIGNIIGKGASLSFKVDNATKGHYQFETTNPVIVAVLPKRQPAAGVLASQDRYDWSAWSPSTLDMNKIRSVTTKPLQ